MTNHEILNALWVLTYYSLEYGKAFLLAYIPTMLIDNMVQRWR